MNRRDAALVLLLVVAAPLAAWAQPAEKLFRVGFLGNSNAALESNLVGPFREGLRDLGYVEGRNVLIEYRWAEGLMSFGPNYADMHRRAAYFVDRILKGAKPAELPVERPATFELVVNLKAAKAPRLSIPQSVLVRATELIK